MRVLCKISKHDLTRTNSKETSVSPLGRITMCLKDTPRSCWQATDIAHRKHNFELPQRDCSLLSSECLYESSESCFQCTMFVTCQHDRGVSFKHIATLSRGKSKVIMHEYAFSRCCINMHFFSIVA